MRLIQVTLTGALCLFAAPVLAQGGAKPSDPQIAHIAYTAGEIDIKAAKQALKISKNKEVRGFANDMVRDHAAVNKKALALVKKLKVTPEDNDTSRTLTKQAEDKMKSMESLKGADFDKAYVENEVTFHKNVNAAVQDTLIPSANNQELKDLLSQGLKIFQGHQQHAEHLAQKIQ